MPAGAVQYRIALRETEPDDRLATALTIRARIAISGTEFPQGTPISDILDMAVRLQVQRLELWLPQNFEMANLPRLRRTVAERGLRAVVISTWTQLNLPGDVSPRQALIGQSIEAAQELEAPLVNTYFGRNLARRPQEALEAYALAIEPCLKKAEKAGVTIVLENEFDPQGNDPSRRAANVKALVEMVGPPHFRANCDPANFHIAGEEAYPRAYQAVKSLIAYVHVKDPLRYDPAVHGPREAQKLFRDVGEEFICTDLGKGAVNWAGVLDALVEDDYQGYFGFEPHVPMERLEETFQRSIAWFLHHWKGA